jgi:hypothetical protein
MVITSRHTKACFDAWIICEDLLVNMVEVQRSFSKQITKTIDECALICMSTFHALKSQSVNTKKYALLCVGICEECAEFCDKLDEEHFKQCAKVCRQCSETMSALIPLSPKRED